MFKYVLYLIMFTSCINIGLLCSTWKVITMIDFLFFVTLLRIFLSNNKENLYKNICILLCEIWSTPAELTWRIYFLIQTLKLWDICIWHLQSWGEKYYNGWRKIKHWMTMEFTIKLFCAETLGKLSIQRAPRKWWKTSEHVNMRTATTSPVTY